MLAMKTTKKVLQSVNLDVTLVTLLTPVVYASTLVS